jgi:hypothetical protein
MKPDADSTLDLLRLWKRLPPSDRHMLLRFARLLLERRLSPGLAGVLGLWPRLYEADVMRAEETHRQSRTLKVGCGVPARLTGQNGLVDLILDEAEIGYRGTNRVIIS